MNLTEVEEPVVRRAVAAYLEAKKNRKGAFTGETPDEILSELAPSPERWAHLAAFVIEVGEHPEDHPELV
jgi:hypothetical protein